MSVADGREKAFYKFCAAAGAQTRSPRAGLGLRNSTMAENLAGFGEELRTIIRNRETGPIRSPRAGVDVTKQRITVCYVPPGGLDKATDMIIVFQIAPSPRPSSNSCVSV